MRDAKSVQRALRIAFIDSWLQTAEEGSGTAVGIGGLEDALRRKGHAVERITPPLHGFWTRRSITARRLLFNLALPRQFDRHAYDRIVGFDFDGVWLPRGDRPYVCAIKGVIAEEALQEQGRIRALFQALSKLEGRNARRADRVITTSAYCRERIAYHYNVPPERIGIVPEGIDTVAWERAILAAPPRTDVRPTILCVARDYPRKRIGDLVQAVAALRRYLPDVQLRIVGDGPLHAEHVALVDRLGLHGTVTFLGAIADEQVKRQYAHADVFCLPSRQEGFGIVFLEAMIAGLPIVSTTAAAIPEVVQHGATGILVPPQDVASLAGALLMLLTDRERRMAYGAAAREAVLQYDWRRVAQTFLHELDR